jgi:Dynactin p62 family
MTPSSQALYKASNEDLPQEEFRDVLTALD